jgi:hypothetical protein
MHRETIDYRQPTAQAPRPRLLTKRRLLKGVTFLGIIAILTWCYSRFVPNFVVSGTVIDQAGKPVPGATLTFESWERKMLLPLPPYGVTYRSSLKVSCRTDSNGRFSIGSPRETLKLIQFNKPGFVLGPILANPEWPYDPNTWRFKSRSGVVLKAYDDSVPRPTLVSVKRDLMLKPDGAPIFLSLSSSTQPTQPGAADMSLSFDGETLSVRVPSGGIWVGNNEFLYAPEADYLPGVDCRIRKRGRDEYSHWTHAMLFYAKSGEDQKFSRGRFTIKNAGSDLKVVLEASVDPGSRDLRGAQSYPEPDPRGGHSTRVDVGTLPWWKQNRYVTPVH